jgi:hypothetical protein
MRRREVYATSGTRPTLRFFGGSLSGIACGDANFIAEGYSGGEPMGGEIGPSRGAGSPTFAVLAVKDPGEPGVPGTPLQRIQIIKGWIDDQGNAQEKVFEVAGNPSNGATVNTATCETSGPGADSLCAVWRDPDFDSAQRAFYYARVLENPVCRWSTRLCNAQGVDCGVGAPPGLEECCDVPKTIQERAWSSPIWYRPEAVGRFTVKIVFGSRSGEDRFSGRLQVGRVPAAVDPATQPITLSLRDDDDVLNVTLPAGALRAVGTGRWVYHDRTGAHGGLTDLTWKSQPKRGSAVIAFKGRNADLSTADREDHMVTLRLSIGALDVEETRLWRSTPKMLLAKR